MVFRRLSPGSFLNFSKCRTLAVLAAAGFVAACPSADLVAEPGAQPQRPLIVAHRGGTADAPENTLAAIRSALSHRVDMIWLSVQLSRDGVPVLYRPESLASLTDGTGRVADRTLEELQRLNAGWPNTPREPIPTLTEALAAIPPNVPVILDMKALPAVPQAAAVARVIAAHHAWERVYLYSTDPAYQRAFAAWPEARLFESRDDTRHRLVNVALARQCEAPTRVGVWAGFEMNRAVEVVEQFTLGEGRSPARAALWTEASVACFRQSGNATLVAFGVNDAGAYATAARLGMNAVMVDSPRAAAAWRASPPATWRAVPPETSPDRPKREALAH